MTPIARIRTTISGFEGGPGIATHYFGRPSAAAFDQASVDDCAERVRVFYQSIRLLFAGGVNLIVQPQVDILNDANGEVGDTFTAAVADDIAPVPGTDSLPPSTALLVQWRTLGFVHGHRVVGRTFLAPVGSGNSLDGAVTIAARAASTAPGLAMASPGDAAGSLVVWSRPVEVATATVPARDGSSWQVTGVTTAAKFAVLRSRRD